MSIGRGIMQTGRIDVFPTTTIIVSILPALASCGTPLTFTIEVSDDGYTAPPDGYVIVRDMDTEIIIGGATLTPAGSPPNVGQGIFIIIPTINGPQIWEAEYEGKSKKDGYTTLYQFAPSKSAINSFDIMFIDTVTTVDTTPFTYFCYHEDFTVSASVTAGGSPISGGLVEFRLYSDGYNFVSLGVDVLVAGSVSIIIPAGSTIPTDTYYLQTLYLGDVCYGISESPRGVDGTAIISTRLDTTITSVPTMLPASPPHSRTGPIMFTATITATNLPSFAVGTVSFFATSPLGIALGTSYLGAGTTSHTAVVPSTVIAPISNGVVLPVATIHVGSTDGFTLAGTMYLSTSGGTQAITYTGITTGGDPSFTGCTGGTPGSTITPAGDVCAFAVPASTFTVADWTIHATYNSDGYCYAGSVGSSGVFTIDS